MNLAQTIRTVKQSKTGAILRILPTGESGVYCLILYVRGAETNMGVFSDIHQLRAIIRLNLWQIEQAGISKERAYKLCVWFLRQSPGTAIGANIIHDFGFVHNVSRNVKADLVELFRREYLTDTVERQELFWGLAGLCVQDLEWAKSQAATCGLCPMLTEGKDRRDLFFKIDTFIYE